LRNSQPSTPNIFSAIADLPFETSDPFLYSFPAVDNKANTLTQGQMFKDHESTRFISAQTPELEGLQKMNVFDVNLSL
jgi:hypothetical protein